MTQVLPPTPKSKSSECPLTRFATWQAAWPARQLYTFWEEHIPVQDKLLSKGNVEGIVSVIRKENKPGCVVILAN